MSIRAKHVHFTNWAKVIEAIAQPDVTTESAARTFLTTNNNNPFYYMVCFIKETKELYTHGQFYQGDLSNVITKDYLKNEYIPEYALTAGDLTGRIEATAEEFIFRPSAGFKSIKDDSALIKAIKGNTYVWNQLHPDPAMAGVFAIGGTDGGIVDGFRRITSPDGLPTTLKIQRTAGVPNGIIGHKYLVTFTARTNGDSIQSQENGVLNKILNASVTSEDIIHYSYIGTAATTNGMYQIIISTNATYLDCRYPQYYDLTQMFGAGNEPSTVEEFRALFPNEYYDYNSGELRSMTATGILTTGFNQWDNNRDYMESPTIEDGDFSSLLNDTIYVGLTRNGYADATKVQATKISNGWSFTANAGGYGIGGFIKAIPNQVYHCSCNSEKGRLVVGFYDKNKKVISQTTTTNFTTPLNCAYILLVICAKDAYIGQVCEVTDICVNLSHTGYRNGEYEPYKEFLHDLSVIKKYFPNGMRSAGSVYDEMTSTKAITRVGAVDLGTLHWARNSEGTMFFYTQVEATIKSKTGINCACAKYASSMWTSASITDKCISIQNDYTSANSTSVMIKDSQYTDATAFREAMRGVMLYYELAEPIETDITDVVDFNYTVYDFGTEEIISDSATSHFKGDIIYQFNAEGRIHDNERNIEKLAKQQISEETIANWGFTKNTGTYVKPDSGIALEDLSADIQASLSKADTAIQDISGKLDSDAVTADIVKPMSTGSAFSDASESGMLSSKIDYLRGNRLAFLSPEEYTIEKKIGADGNWETLDSTTSGHRGLFAGLQWNTGVSIGSNFSIGSQIRITIHPTNALRKGYIDYVAIRVFENGRLFNAKLEYASSLTNPTWEEVTNKDIRTPRFTPTCILQYNKYLSQGYGLRITITAINDKTSSSAILSIGAYGSTDESTASVTAPYAMARLGHMYSWDYLQNVEFPNQVKAKSLYSSEGITLNGGSTNTLLQGTGAPINKSELEFDPTQISQFTSFKQIDGSTWKLLEPMHGVLRANRLAFLSDEEFKVEMSTDNGATWVEQAKTDNMRKVFCGDNSGSISMTSNVNNQMRITLMPTSLRYCYIDYFYFFVGVPWKSSSACATLDIEYCTGDDKETWLLDKSNVPLNGQTGPNMFTYRGLFAGSSSYGIRFTIKLDGTYSTSTLICGIEAHGNRAWNASSPAMARWDHLYTTNPNQDAIFPAKVKATDFVYEDGTTIAEYVESVLPTDTISAIVVNGFAKTPSNGTVNLGTVNAYTLLNHGTSDTTYALTPNVFHVWNEVPSLTLTLASETSNIANEYLFQFTSGATATTLTLPTSVKFPGELSIEANKIYQISILGNLGTILQWEV